MLSTTRIFLLALFYVSATGATLSEQDVVFTALENNSDIRIARLETRTDSLTLEKLQTQQLPSVNATLRQQVKPYDSTLTSGSNTPSVSTGVTVSALQNVPGGGTVTADIAGERTGMTDGDSVQYTSSLALTYTQPLLRNAWKHDPVAYTIKIQRLDNKTFTLRRKKKILASLSDVRNRYWTFYEKQSLCTIFADRKQYAEKRLTTQRTRFSIGTATMLDTLSAHLAFLEATRQLLIAQTEAALAHRALAVALALSPDSVTIDSVKHIQLTGLPEPDDFLRLVESFDPQIQLFETLNEKLRRQAAYAANQLLPDVALEAGYSRVASGDDIFDASGSFSGNAVFALIVRYALPVKSRRIERQQAGIALKSNNIAREQYMREMVKKVEELNLTWEQELQTLAIEKTSQEIARRQFDAAKAGFDLGTVDQLTLDKAEDDYLETTIRYLQKQVVMKKLEIIFEEITGKVLSRFGVKLE